MYMLIDVLRWCLASLAVLSFSRIAMAYPMLAKHGYTTCLTCHYSPSGGGVLTPYGKYVAQELLGTFNDTESALPWLVTPVESPDFVAMVMARGAQTHFDTPQVKRSAFRKMQFDIEGGWVNSKGWQALAAVGPKLDAAVEGEDKPGDLQLRRASVGIVNLDYAFRLGKFFPEYGINLPNHNSVTRKGLYFNQGEEPLNVQASMYTATFDYTLSFIQGSDATQLADRKGYAANVAYKYTTYRFGASRLEAKGDGSTTMAQGVFAQLGYLSKGYALLEIDEKSSENQLGRRSRTRLGYLETGWEVFHGFNPFIVYEYTKNFQTDLIITTPQIGLQWHPWTHLELVLQTGKSSISISGEKQTAKSAVAMINLYL